MRIKHTLLLLVVLTAAPKLCVDADETTMTFGVRARVVNYCKVSTPDSIRNDSIEPAKEAVRVRCEKPAVWKVDFDRGRVTRNAEATSDTIRVPIHF